MGNDQPSKEKLLLCDERLAEHFGLTAEDKAYFADLEARVKKMEEENPIDMPPNLTFAEQVDYILTKLGWRRKLS